MKKLFIFIWLFLLLTLSGGCMQFGTYIKNRGNDFVDCFKIDGGFLGVGIEAHARVTDAFATGIGAALSQKYGFKGRELTGPWVDWHWGLPFSPITWFIPSSDDELKFPITYYGLVGDEDSGVLTRRYNGIRGSYETASLICYPLIFRKEPHRDMLEQKQQQPYRLTEHGPVRVDEHKHEERPFGKNLIDSFDIEMGATACLFVGISVHVGFSPGQFVDFLTGWFGADIGNDDYKEP